MDIKNAIKYAIKYEKDLFFTYHSPCQYRVEAMIANSIKFAGADEKIYTEDAYSQQKEHDIWGNLGIWK